MCCEVKKSCGNSSVGRASASQAEGREFEPRLPLTFKSHNQGITDWSWLFCFIGEKTLKKPLRKAIE